MRVNMISEGFDIGYLTEECPAVQTVHFSGKKLMY